MPTVFTRVYVDLPFSRSKLDFSSFLVKEVKFRQIEISPKVNLLFLIMY